MAERGTFPETAAAPSEHPNPPQQEITRGEAAFWPAALQLGGYAFLILFFELAFIRYISAYVRVFGFYVNFVLIATFLGMGVGMMRADKAQMLKWMGPVLAVSLFVLVKYFSNVIINVPDDQDEALWGVYFEIASTVRRIGILPTVAILFAVTTGFFVPLGALMGEQFRRFRPLDAYSIDIGGSLLGIGVFGLLSFLRTPPAVWFLLGGTAWLLLSVRPKPYGLTVALGGAAMVCLSLWTSTGAGEYWSPYYRINVADYGSRHSINVNGSFHQWVIDFQTGAEGSDLEVARIQSDYREPFRFFEVPDTVLVVGAGTGNDVALLLDLGVKHVDAVEIDPVILDLGRALHAQAPYVDPRVHTHVTDAREFLRRTKRKYDLIVFGTLDSQTLLSGMSSLRLDNYVYTVEAFRAARDRLKERGNLVAYHMSPVHYITGRLYSMLHIAFEAPPAFASHKEHRLFNSIFIAGSAAADARAVWGEPDVAGLLTANVPTDDWPYLYLRRPTIPRHYMQALAVVFAVALGAVGLIGGRRVVRGFDWTMFFMGAGFLLLETKSVSEMSLLFGATWQVNLLVFSSILVMILAANQWVLRRRIVRLELLFLGLFATLGVAALVPAGSLLRLGEVGQWIFGGLIVASPVFFAAVIFAALFGSRTDATRALAANLLGAVIGGAAEYSSMVVGIKGLYIFAALAYGMAFYCSRAYRPAFGKTPLTVPLTPPPLPVVAVRPTH